MDIVLAATRNSREGVTLVIQETAQDTTSNLCVQPNNICGVTSRLHQDYNVSKDNSHIENRIVTTCSYGRTFASLILLPENYEAV